MDTRYGEIDRRRVGELGIAGGAAFILIVALFKLPILVALVVPGFACLLLLFALLRAYGGDQGPERAAWLRKVTLYAFALHLGIAVVISSVPSLVQTFGGDAVTYHLGSIDLLNHWTTGTRLTHGYLSVGKEGFFYLLASLYWLFGPYQISGLLVVAAVSAALVPVVYDTTGRLFGPDAARVAALLVLVQPAFLVWTSQLLREGPVIFCLALAANAAVRLSKRGTADAYGVFAVSVAVLFTLRADVALVAAAGLLVGGMVGRKHLVAGVASGIASIGLVAVIVLAGGIGYSGYKLASSANLQQVSQTRQALAYTASSGIAPQQDVSTPHQAIGFLPVALVDFGFGPFLWTARNARQLSGVAEALTLWYLFPSLLRGWRAAGRSVGRRRLVLGIPAVLVAVALSLLIGNFGTVVRERLQVTIFLVPFMAEGWRLRALRRNRDRPVKVPGQGLRERTI